MDLSNLSFEDSVKVEAMQQAYDFGLPISGVMSVYNHLVRIAAENNIQLSDNLSIRVNSIIKILTGSMNNNSALIQKCIETDKKCFDILYDSDLSRNLFAESLIRLILENQNIQDPEEYVSLLDLKIKNTTKLAQTDGREHEISEDSDFFMLASELRDGLMKLSENELLHCSSKQELIDKVLACAKERCNVKYLDAFGG